MDTTSIFGVQLPVVVVAALAGSAMTLLGVFAQNFFENRRAVRRFRHEAELKERERTMNLRREIFLEAAKDLFLGLKYLGRSSDLSISPSQHNEMLGDFGSALSRIHMIASLATIEKVVAFNDCFVRLNFIFQRRRFLLLEKQMQIDALNNEIDEEIALQTNVVERIGQLQTINSHHPSTPELVAKYQQLASHIDQSQARRDGITAQLLEEKLEFTSEVAKKTITLGLVLVEANIAIRREMETALTIDEDSYRKVIGQSLDCAVSETESFLKQLSEDIGVGKSSSKSSS